MKCTYCNCPESDADLRHVVTSGTHFKQGESLHLCPDCYATYRRLNPDPKKQTMIAWAIIGGFFAVAILTSLVFGY
ncbi:hypothetical protein [Limnoglobus roseus]|uniref:Uncharacterized protein n=1 Tax=Limnoglobus roseus TaxID=2598579 RepID=A0A5C1AFB3_9BACT|nr:hypothetical protein [Limnoglobus roseus]QEL16913.1 hypothetical protein PX52LOC_03889 [Limnoglobus roseus]